MQQVGHRTSALELPSAPETTRAIDQARRLYGKTLANWAADTLVLRRADLIRPTWTQQRRDDDSWSLAA